jgi:hypothetical protein
MSAHRNRTWDEATGLPEVSAPLERPPAGLDLAADFPEPLRYDPARRRLLYRGFMCRASYLFLRGLSADPAYLAALDVLFQSSADALPGGRPRRLWAWLAAALCLAGAAAAAWTLLR